MIYQQPNLREELHGVRKSGVVVEGGFIDPARMDVEQPRIAGGAEGLDRHATGFGARGNDDLANRGCDGIFPALKG